jgi:hypothetical protein
MSKEQIITAAREAVSAGALPRIVEAVSFRGGNNRISILDGTEIPQNALDIGFVESADGQPEDIIIRKSLTVPIPGVPAEGDSTGLYQEAYILSPQTTPEEWEQIAQSMYAALQTYTPPQVN